MELINAQVNDLNTKCKEKYKQIIIENAHNCSVKNQSRLQTAGKNNESSLFIVSRELVY